MFNQSKKADPLDRNELRRAAIDLLSRRDYSRLELERKLSPKAADQQELLALLDDLSERDWQSDQRFAQSFLNSRYQRGHGPLRLRQELRQKGINDELISLTFEQAEIDWFEQAALAAEKKANSLKADDPQRKQKLYRFLAYRGFSSDQIQAVLD